ncbi:MAG: hypothetical protein QY318_01330 [Candidatus Dojkabacteria bacterium]|nr:MAG: hypothetical protein QY318_01330 [Candidatus Dojkabacteria bacterium]
MAEAGAGVIGNYSHCAFITSGHGNWLSKAGAKPAIGEVGKMSREPENKIEMVCPEDRLGAVLEAIKNSHPYETPAVDVIEMKTLAVLD